MVFHTSYICAMCANAHGPWLGKRNYDSIKSTCTCTRIHTHIFRRYFFFFAHGLMFMMNHHWFNSTIHYLTHWFYKLM